MRPLNHSIMKNFDNSRSLLHSPNLTIPVNWPRICTSRPPGTPFANSKILIMPRMLETTLSNKRILEHYLNIIEWGHGVFGIEASALR